MPAPPESKPVFISQKIYGRLLLAYPRRHRREYGAPMAQLFRDQCRDAWRAARSWGLVGLWFRVLPDLVKTSFLEHLSELKGKKSMAEKISAIVRPGFAPLKAFFGVGLLVFLLVFGLSALVTFIMPESYSSTVRIKVEPDAAGAGGMKGGQPVPVYDPYFVQTEFEVIQSELILAKVAEALDLNAAWAKKYAAGEKLKTSETIELLKARMELRPVRNTSLIEIRVFSEDPAEAARIANTIGKVYHDHRLAHRQQVAMDNLQALKEQFDEQDQKVRVAQKEVDMLRKELNISDFDGIGNAPSPVIDADVVRRLQGDLVSFQTTLVREETQVAELERLKPNQRRQALTTAVGTDNELSTLLHELNTAEQKLISLQTDFAPTHPSFVSAKVLAVDADNRVNARVEGVMIGLSNRVSTARATVDSLKASLDKARSADIEKAERSRPYYEAKLRLDEAIRFRSVLGSKLASERVDVALPNTTLVEIINVARPGLRPVRPNKPLNLALGAFCGMVLGLTIGGGAALVATLRKRAGGQAAVL